ncbi:MAG TPA: lytic transglycosylase domain-containing protein [Terracidiphilus sp.]|nr:lytic transglycosylase domain-containing protein [Terracidiphilus sp.]
MDRGIRLRIGLQLGTAAMVLAVMPVARAAEVATLTNGFTMRCDHHAEVEGRIRLYLHGGDNSYIEFGPGEIKSFEPVADLPVQAAAKDQAPAEKEDANLKPGDLRQMLAAAGHEHNLDVDLLASVVKAESGGNARAISRAGARGLMQLMPGTAADLGVEDSFRPSENVRGGSIYLDRLLMRYHDNLALALAAYNAGPEAVERYHGIPPYHETREYVARVIHEFNRRVKARRAEQAREANAASATKVTSTIE